MEKTSKLGKEDLLERRKETKLQALQHGRSTTPQADKAGGAAALGQGEPVGARQLLAKARDSSSHAQRDGNPRDPSGPAVGGWKDGPPGIQASIHQGSASSLSPMPHSSASGVHSAGEGGGKVPGGSKALGGNDSKPEEEDNDGVDKAEERAFIDQLRAFYRGRGTDFRIPKFYGNSVNLLKLWRIVCHHGGYDKVTSGKLWRVVGDHFNPPKSCTTLSWSFRGFYEKALLDYERVNGVPSPQDLGTFPRSLRMKLEGSKGKATAGPAEGGTGGAGSGGGYLCGLPPAAPKIQSEDSGAAATLRNPKEEDGEGAKTSGSDRKASDSAAGNVPPSCQGPGSGLVAGPGSGPKANEGSDPVKSLSSSRKRPAVLRGPGDAVGRGEEASVEPNPRSKASPSEGRAEAGPVKKVRKSSAETPPRQSEGKAGVAQKQGAAGRGPAATSPSGERGEKRGDKGEKGGEKGESLSTGKSKAAKEGKKLADALSQDPGQQPAVVWDVGEECSWVKVSVRRSSDCFEIYALVPGLLREEIKIQVEGPGRVVISGIPEREHNPWGVKKFKKIVILPGAVAAAEAKAVVALHGQLYIHVPLAGAEAKVPAGKS